MKSTLWHAALLAAVAGQLTLVARVGAQQESDWPSSRPPRPLAARDVQFPPYEVRTLSNGLQVVVVLQHEQPAVSMRLIVKAGQAQDPEGKAGVASLMGALLDQGTQSKTASELAEAIDYVGGGLSSGAGSDLSFVNVLVMKHDFGFGLDLLSEVARRPAFAPEEVGRQREQILSTLQVNYQDPDYVADTIADRLVYGFHPYGLPSSGTQESIARITRDDVVAFHQAYFVPNNAILAIVGDVSAEEAFGGAQRVFGNWERKEVPVREVIAPPSPTRRIIVVDRPGAVQTEVRVGHLGIPRKHEDYLPLSLAARILGGEGANRLHGVLRSQRGLTYGASADLAALKQAGDVIAETDTRSDATAEVVRVIFDEFSRLLSEPVGSRELDGAKAYITGSFPLTIEVPDAIAMQVLNTLFFDLDVKDLETFRERVMSVTPEDIQRAAKTYIDPARLAVVLVGDAKVFLPSLKGAGFGEYELLRLEDLDLTAPDFKRAASRAVQP